MRNIRYIVYIVILFSMFFYLYNVRKRGIKHSIISDISTLKFNARMIFDCIHHDVLDNEDSFPKNEKELMECLKKGFVKDYDVSKGLLRDTFSKNGVLKIIYCNDSIILYSIGPDRIDQNRTVIYDPTNGINSHGDIIFEIKKSQIETLIKRK